MNDYPLRGIGTGDHFTRTGQLASLRLLGCWVLTAILPFFANGNTYGQDAIAKESLLITVSNPITGAVVEQIKSSLDKTRNQANTKLETVVFDFTPDGKEAFSPSYGSCYDLSRYIREITLNGVKTVAFVANKATGHTVLPILACGELAMSESGAIGEVVDKNAAVPPKAELDNYIGFGKPEYEGLILKMLDKNAVVMRGTLNQGTIYFDKRRDNEPKYQAVRNPQPVLEMNPGVVELYNTTRARSYGLCSVVLENKQKVAEWYGVNIRGDFLQGRAPKACRIEFAGIIDDALKDKIHRQLREAAARNDNTIFFIMNSEGGGSASAARELADEIANLEGPDKQPIRTIAYIPSHAPDLAGMVAMACSEIVMYKGSQPENEATIGDFEVYLNNPKAGEGAAEYLKKNLPDILRLRGLPEVLAVGLLDKNSEIVSVRNQKTAARTVMTRQELDQKNADAREWIREKTLKQPGSYLKLSATQAKELRLATATVDNREFKDVLAHYGFEEKDVRDAKPHWLDSLAAVLRRTEVSALLVLIGIAGLILELKIPGLTVPGIVSAVCFLLFFWAQSQMSGQIIYLAMLLFILGILLIGIEIFLLPGFGVTGVSGVLLVAAGLGLATIDHIPQSQSEWVEFGSKMCVFGGSMVGSIFLVILFGRFLPNIPFFNKLVYVPAFDRPGEEDDTPLPGAEEAAALLGAVGVTTSTLRPAGLVKIADRFIDVVSEGDFIDAGVPIQVIEVEGTRIVVKRVG